MPLVVEKHFFTKVVVEANPDHRPEKGKGQEVRIQTRVQGGHRTDDPRRWRLILTVGTEAAEEEKLPYKFNLECVGFFTVSPEVEEKKIPFLVHANGAAILYSSAREFLLMVTNRGPWGGFYLPTTNFLQPQKVKEEKSLLSGSEPHSRQQEAQETVITAPRKRAIKGTAKAKENRESEGGEE